MWLKKSVCFGGLAGKLGAKNETMMGGTRDSGAGRGAARVWRGERNCALFMFFFFKMRQATDSVVVDDKRAWALRGRLGEGVGGLDECRWLGKSKNSSGWGRLTRPARPDAMPAHHHTPGLGLRLMETDGRHVGGRNGHGPSNVFMFSDAMLMPREGAILDERERDGETRACKSYRSPNQLPMTNILHHHVCSTPPGQTIPSPIHLCLFFPKDLLQFQAPLHLHLLARCPSNCPQRPVLIRNGKETHVPNGPRLYWRSRKYWSCPW